MHETNNWVTPQFDYQQPFWGKPPMHTWITAASFSALGVSAFTARLPHFICGLLILLLVYHFARKISGKTAAILSCLILTSSLGFILATGAVMTDVALLLSLTISLTSFWRAYAFSKKYLYGHMFFASLALGMLIKGPVAIVLVGIALCSWCIWQKTFRAALACLPWSSGLILFSFMTLPWYLLAEYQTPGFLEYFILGEHFQRFVYSGWEGDLYGFAHDQARGTVWLYWFVAALPWSPVLIGFFFRWLATSAKCSQYASSSSSINPYLVCWMLSPMLLFTFSGNILIAYVLPGFAAMALLLGTNGSLTRSTIITACISLFIVSTLPFIKIFGLISKTSEIELLGSDPSLYAVHPLYYWQKRPFSARFYSDGQAALIRDDKKLISLAQGSDGIFIAAELDQEDLLLPALKNICVEKKRSKERFLLFC